MKRVQFIHRNCRNSIYPRTNIQRITVSDQLVRWCEPFADYKPIFYEADSLNHATWADRRIGIALIWAIFNNGTTTEHESRAN